MTSSSDRVTSSLSSGNGYLISATISQYQKPFNYETEKEYGRNFDTENAAYLTGTVQYTGAELSLSLNGSNSKSIAFSTAASNDIINLKTSISNSIDQYIQNIYNKSRTDILVGNIPDITSVTGSTGSQDVTLNTAVYPMSLNIGYDVSSIKDHISVSAQEKESGNYVKNDSGIGYHNYNASKDAGKTRYEIMLEKDSGYTSQVENIKNGVLNGMNQFSVAVTSNGYATASVSGNEKNSSANVTNYLAEIIEIPRAISIFAGTSNKKENIIDIPLYSMNAGTLGLNGFCVTHEDCARENIITVERATDKISAHRSTIGAAQNRLEHTYNNLQNIAENTTAAESRIRDADISKESLQYAIDNILQQAGLAIMQQIGQNSAMVLSLLQ